MAATNFKMSGAKHSGDAPALQAAVMSSAVYRAQSR